MLPHPSPQDYQANFDLTPGNYLLLNPDLTIVGVNRGTSQLPTRTEFVTSAPHCSA